MKWLLLVGLMIFSFLSFAEDTRWIDLEWEQVEDAREYEIELFQQEGDKVLPRGKYKTDSAEWSHAVPPGKYSLRLRSVDKRGVPGEWSANIPLKVRMQNPKLLRPVPSDKVSDPMVTFEWAAVEGAANYQLVVQQGDKILHNALTTELNASVYLESLGKTQWTVFALEKDEEARSSDNLPANAFSLFTRTGTVLDAPFVSADLKEKVSIGWKKVNLAQVYQIDYFPPPESGDKNRRFSLKKSPMIFPAARLKEGVTTITVRAIAPGHQDSRKSIIKISKSQSKVELEDLIQGKEEEAEKIAPTKAFFRNELFFGVMVSKFSYKSENDETDTELDQESLSGLGLMGEWNHRPTLNALNRKLELSLMNLSSGVDSGMAGRLAYSWNKENKSMFVYGAGLSVLKLPVFLGNRFTDKIEVESAISFGPEFNFGIKRALSQLWETQAGIVAAYHPVYISSDLDGGKAYLWLKGYARFLRYYTEKQAFFGQLDYQKWDQSWSESSSSLTGFVITIGLKNSF